MKISCGNMWSLCTPPRRQVDLRPEPVTNLRIRKNVLRRGGVIAELLSQLPDKRPEILQLSAVFRPPDRPQNARVRKRKSGVRHQKMKQLIFLGSHVDWRSRSLDLPPCRIDFDLSMVSGTNGLRLASDPGIDLEVRRIFRHGVAKNRRLSRALFPSQKAHLVFERVVQDLRKDRPKLAVGGEP